MRTAIHRFNQSHDTRPFYRRRWFWVLSCFLFPVLLEAALLIGGQLLLQAYSPAEQAKIRSSFFYQIQYEPYKRGVAAYRHIMGSPVPSEVQDPD